MKIRWIAAIFALLLTFSVTATTILLGGKATTNVRSIMSLSLEEQQPPWFYEISGGVSSVSISSDGNYIVVGGGDNMVYLFSRLSNTPLWNHETGGDVQSVSISSDGSYVVAGSDDGKIYFFSRENGLLWDYQTGPSTYFSPRVSISSDGSYIAAGGTDNIVYFFSHSDNIPLRSSHDTVEMSGYSSVSMSSDGGYIAVLAWGVYFFSRESGIPMWTNKFYGGSSISVSSGGSYIATAGWGDTTLFSHQSNEPLWSYEDPSPSGSSVWGPQPNYDDKQVSISSNGEYIVSCASHAATEEYYVVNRIGRVHLFSRVDNTPIWTYNESEWIYLVSISSDGGYIAVANDRGKVYIFSRGSNTPLRSWVIGSYTYDNKVSYGCTINSISISSDGSYIAVGSSQGVNLLSKDVSNSPPTLSAENVYPEYGEVGVTTLTFEVTYTDADNDTPENIEVRIGTYISPGERIDFTEQNMAKVSGDYPTGAIYRCTWIPSFAGEISYSFRATDGKMGRAYKSGRKSPDITRAVTSLTVSPQSFILGYNRQTTLTATLTSYGTSISDKTISWSATDGSFSSLSSITDSSGRASVTYHAPENATYATITASFAKDNSYQASSGSASCIIFKATFTFRKPDGTPLANREIYYGISTDNIAEYLGTTDNEGKITSDNHELANQTIYFKTFDGKYAGSTSVSATGGEVTTELAEIPELPVAWIILAVAIVAAVIGIVVFVKKKK